MYYTGNAGSIGKDDFQHQPIITYTIINTDSNTKIIVNILVI